MAVYTTIDDAGSFFNTVLYTGTGSSLAVTGAGFQPDFTWIKGRSFVGSQKWTDAVRGVTKELESNTTIAENTEANGLTAFGADGFTVGSNADYNTSSATLVAWNWKAGTTTGIDTTGSTITPSSYSFNATSGFSVIAYTGNGSAGALVPHGLGVAPGLIIVKRLDSSGDWQVYDRGLGNTKFMILNSSTSESVDTDRWNDTSPTSVLFSLGDNANVNGSTNTYIAYCFADVQGYTKIGSYTGNGDADGTFVYTGFRPGFVLIKRTDLTKNWIIWDSKRLGYNTFNEELYPDATTGEDGASYRLDIVSNGFKLRSSSATVNDGDFMFITFAEAPFVNSSGVPVNAR